MGVLQHRTVSGGASGESLPVYCDRIVDEELDSDGGEACGGWSPRAILRRLVSKKELRSVNRKAGDGAVEAPQNRCAKRRFVELNRGFSVANGQHGRNLSFHGIDLTNRRY